MRREHDYYLNRIAATQVKIILLISDKYKYTVRPKILVYTISLFDHLVRMSTEADNLLGTWSNVQEKALSHIAATVRAARNIAAKIKPRRMFDYKKKVNFRQWVTRLNTYFDLVYIPPENRTAVLLLNFSREISFTARW